MILTIQKKNYFVIYLFGIFKHNILCPLRIYRCMLFLKRNSFPYMRFGVGDDLAVRNLFAIINIIV